MISYYSLNYNISIFLLFVELLCKPSVRYVWYWLVCRLIFKIQFSGPCQTRYELLVLSLLVRVLLCHASLSSMFVCVAVPPACIYAVQKKACNTKQQVFFYRHMIYIVNVHSPTEIFSRWIILLSLWYRLFDILFCHQSPFGPTEPGEADCELPKQLVYRRLVQRGGEQHWNRGWLVQSAAVLWHWLSDRHHGRGRRQWDSFFESRLSQIWAHRHDTHIFRCCD